MKPTNSTLTVEESHRPPDSDVAATDGELIMQFVHHRDDAAFALIVERHGRLVWMICRQLLRRREDVEDAFQATFFILAQRAATIRASDSTAAWLFKVAQRTALAARRRRSARREEPLVAEPPQGEAALPMIHDRQMFLVLIEELRSLPERYQMPLVLRYFENQSLRAIAEQTDSSVGQIQGRLVRGRRMLRSRLVRRGVSLSLAAGAVTSAAASASAAITPPLVADTSQNCLEFNASGVASGASPASLDLAKEGIKAMGFVSTTKVAAVIGALLIAAGIAWASQQGDGSAEGAATIAVSKEVELQVAAKASEPREAARVDITAAVADGATQEYVAADKEGSARRAEVEHVRYDVWSPPAHVRRLALEREHWALKAQAYQLKARVQEQVAKRYAGTAEEQDAKAEMMLAEAESKLAEAKALQLEMQLQTIHQHGEPQAAAAPASSRPDGQTIQSRDGVLIHVIGLPSNAPINDVFVVEPMGTVALGPAYGRVKVEGLTVLEAEKAVVEHLNIREEAGGPGGAQAEDLAVQVTMAFSGRPPQPPPAPSDVPTQFSVRSTSEPMSIEQVVAQQISQLQQAIAKLQAENAALKNKLYGKRSPPITPSPVE